MDAPQLVVRHFDTLGEGPTWCPRERVLWWLDVWQGTIHRLDPATGALRHWQTGLKPHALALREAGGLLLTVRNGFAVFDTEAETLRQVRSAAPHLPRNFLNDGKVDRRGRFWAGSCDRDLRPCQGDLYRLAPDLSVATMDRGISLSNGLGWSPDDRFMYYADTGVGRVYRYAFDAEAGTVADRRVFVDATDLPGEPDGLTVDAEGGVWTAQFDGHCVLRFAPDGRLDRRIDLPVAKVTSVEFGGDDLATLYVTSASIGLSAEERRAQPEAGGLFALRPGVAGQASTRFPG